MFCKRFIIFFSVFSVTRPRPPHGQGLVGILNDATCNVYSPKAFETSIHENVTYYVLYCVGNIFSFGFIEALDSKQKNVSERARITSLVVREITSVLKIAVNSVTLELCGSRDYFASSLLVKKTD